MTYSGRPNRILADLARRQLEFDFKLTSSPYTAVRNVGAGAFGIVCEAIDTRYADTRVAVKKIAHAAATPTLARRTLREVRVLRYVGHDNIVPLLDMFQMPGAMGIDVYLVFELMDGSLYHVIHGADTPLDNDLIASFLYQILRGVRVSVSMSL